MDNITHFYSLRSPATYQETLKLQSPYNSVHGVIHSSYVIMAFDLDNERFQLLDLPRNILPDYYSEVSMASYGDTSALSLSFCGKYYEQGVKFDVWVMGDYGLADSWKKVFVVSLFRLSIAPLLMKSEREVFIVMKGGRLMLLDAIENEVQHLNMRGAASFFCAISYTPSLALLHGQRRIYRRVNGIKHLQSSLLDYHPLS
ncbi:putative F-box associated domain, type 1 [Helianthus annuus]|nr:putative F-box associated domain, type 1 [Helianthus annuus]